MTDIADRARELISHGISGNQKICHALYACASKKRTAELLSLVREMSSLDTISDPFSLRMLRNEVEEGRVWYTYNEDITNCLCYGIWDALFPFANRERAYQTPSVEHGLILSNAVTKEMYKTSRPACVTFGSYRKNLIQERIPVPVFTVGPYIQYARSFYSESQEQEFHRKAGRTLLYFLSHGVNKTAVNRTEDAIVQKLKEMSRQFDTVLVSVFWWDINESIVDRLASEGFRIVSAGFVNDPVFLPRLKSIISMSDLAVSDSLGTHAAYCSALGIPFAMLDSPPEYVSGSNGRVIIDKSSNVAEAEIRRALNIPENPQAHSTLTYYWGLGLRRTLEERQEICDICEDIYQLTRGSRRAVLKSAKRLLNTYLERGCKVKARLLLEALPSEARVSFRG